MYSTNKFEAKMVGATVQYTEPKLSNLASNWEMKSLKILNLIHKVIPWLKQQEKLFATNYGMVNQ